MDSQVTAGRAHLSSVNICRTCLPLFEQPQSCRLLSHTKAQPKESKATFTSSHFCLVCMRPGTILQACMAAQLQNKLLTEDQQVLNSGANQGTRGSKASTKTTTWALAAPKSASALIRQTAALQIEPQRNNVKEMCQVYHLPCTEMLLFLSCRVTSPALQLAGPLTVSKEKHEAHQQQGNAA